MTGRDDSKAVGAGISGWLRRLYEKRYLISTQIYLAFGAAVALTLAASLVAWFSFDNVGIHQDRVTEVSVPEMYASFGIAHNANTLMSAGPRLAAAANTDDYNTVSQEINAAGRELARKLDALQGSHAGDGTFDAMRRDVDALTENVHTIRDGMPESFQRRAELAAFEEQILGLGVQLDEILVPVLDDLTPGDSKGFSEAEFTQYRFVSDVQRDLVIAIQILTSSFGITDADAIEPLREPLLEAKSRILNNLEEFDDLELRNRVEPLAVELFDLGAGPDGSLDTLEAEAGFLALQQDLIAQNRSIATNLIADVEGFVQEANLSVDQSVLEVGDAVSVGRLLLLIISAASVCGTILIVWILIGRVLLRRLELMLGWMRRMAEGDLEATAEIKGRDEVADMGAALEVFRQNSLEAQRLNLVEKMAQELEQKNTELEKALKDLGDAQDQLVMREKLAALGELTAGVAHEIRNPLNFVKNFAEASEELMEEMRELLDEAGEDIEEGQREYIEEVAGDLTANLDRIRSHGERANRIVHDMLMMGRESNESEPTDINSLFDQYAGLAYHSARAVDPEFHMEIERDFDADVGMLDVLAQDLGRVFLNMVSNACDATDEKRQAALVAGDGDSYMPTLRLSTRRVENAIELRVKDNGNGIPGEIADRIFNPFFTTKPSGKGTGLGLAMSNDIVREHGGAIRVESEPGEFTEMIIELPLSPPAPV